MKKILLSLTVLSTMFLASCEDEFDNENNNNNNGQENNDDGFWDVTCNQYYDSVAVQSCDSIWVQDSTQNQNGTWEVVCDTILSWDSLQNQVYTVDCKQVFVQNNNANNGYWKTECKDTYYLQLVEECDSVWVDDSGSNSGNNDSTNVNNGSNGNNANGNWKIECDTVYDQAQNYWIECDSTWVPAGQLTW